jgi:hypothetical protein
MDNVQESNNVLIYQCHELLNIVKYLRFAWHIKRGFDLMIEFIGPLCNLLQHFTNPCLRLDTLDFWPHYTNPPLPEPESLTVI